MRITQWGEYGVHCAVIISRSEKQSQNPVGAEYIAGELNIDLQYAQQVLQRLRRHGIIKSVRGPHGGYQLSRSSDEISLEEILKASEGGTMDIICESKPIKLDVCHNGSPCYLRDIWHSLRKHIDDFLQGYSLSQLASQESNVGKVIQIGRISTSGSNLS